MLDAHCHFSPVFVERWFNSKNRYLLNATDPSQFADLEAFRQRYPEAVRIGYGVHPYYLHTCAGAKEALEVVKEKLLADATAFVGEIGLDTRPAALADASLKVQMEYFIPQLELAFELNRDCNIHIISRKPGLWPIFTAALKATAKKYKHYDRSVIMHSYNGTFDTFQQLQAAISDCGGRILLSISHFTESNKSTRSCIRRCAEKLLVAETDWYREDEDDWPKAMETAISVIMQERCMARDDALALMHSNWAQYDLLPHLPHISQPDSQ